MNLDNGHLYHYSQGGQRHGPVSAEEITTLAKNGHLTTDAQIWSEEMGEWRPAVQFDQLTVFLIPAPGNAGHVSSPAPLVQSSRSKLAVWALITGIISVVLACLFQWAGCIAIVLAIWAIVSINTSKGKLTGMPHSIIGLILGTVSAVIGFYSFKINQAKQEMRTRYHEVVKADTHTEIPNDLMSFAIEDVSRFVSPFFKQRKKASGNTQEAKEIANSFSDSMKLVCLTLFNDDGKITSSDDDFYTYCQVNENSCAILYFMPNLSGFPDDIQGGLSDLGWIVANVTLQKSEHVGKDLAVAMYGNLKFHRIDEGEVVDMTTDSNTSLDTQLILRTFSGDERPGLDTSSESEGTLYPYFRKFRNSKVQ